MGAMAQRLAQPPDTGSEVVEQGFIGGIAPKQRRQLAAGLAAFWAERQKGEKRAFALSRQDRLHAAGEPLKIKATEQAQRPSW